MSDNPIAVTETLVSALDLFTPVDRSVCRSLDKPVRERHARDLAKRLTVASELCAPGLGGKIMLDRLSEPSGDSLAAELDALLEFGALLSTLRPEEAAQACRGEVREEIRHFDRIMDLEALPSGRKLKRRREFVWDAGPLAATERLLVLLHERRVERGLERAGWHDVAKHPVSMQAVDGSVVVLSRTESPAMVAAACGEGAREVLKELELSALRHPLGIALGLLDYSRFLGGGPPVDLVAAALARSFESSWCDVWAAMETDLLVFRRDGFRHVLREAVMLCGNPIGQQTTRYAHRRIELSKGEQLALVPRWRGLPIYDLLDVEAMVNSPNRSGRIFLREGMRKAYPGATPIFLSGRHGGSPPLRDGDAASRDTRFVEQFTERILTESRGRVHLSIEAGHVHSDRHVGAVQRRGLDLGARLCTVLRERATPDRLRLELTPMIDDDHVVNRLSYGEYRCLIANHGFPADDLILESSPIVSAIALDLLRRALQLDGSAFRLETLGGNLYLVSEGLRLELVQDLDSLRLGCILFDTALVIYRADRSAMADLFFAETGEPPRDVHRAMADAYDNTPRPEDRFAVRVAFDQAWRTTWTNVVETSHRTPYLERYAGLLDARQAAGETTLVLNILEDYYEPLERKVLRIAELLHIELPMDAILFSPYGAGLRQLCDVQP